MMRARKHRAKNDQMMHLPDYEILRLPVGMELRFMGIAEM
jgi:hypothetical protein